MKRVFGILVASVLVLGAGANFAEAGCCAGGDDAKPSVNFTANNDCFAKLNLSADQRSKVTDLLAACKSGNCTVTAREKMAAGLKAILTPEQYAQWTAAGDQTKAAQGGKCPLTSKSKCDHTETKN